MIMKQQHQVTSIDLLNDDILLRIFDYLHFDDKIRLRRINLRWKQLLDLQLGRVKALRVGTFHQGGHNITSGLLMHCEHSGKTSHRLETGTLFSKRILNFPADMETSCFSISQYAYLHRALKHSNQSITMLSLGHLNISYRLLMVLAHNLPNLEHLEIISCASKMEWPSKRKSEIMKGLHHLPSLESFNSPSTLTSVTNTTTDHSSVFSSILFNQHRNEQLNIEERLIRSSLVRNCELVKEAKHKNYWPNFRHLLVKNSNLLNEFSLSLILAISNQSLTHLIIESSQFFTGEFLNYCGPQLKILKLKYCPMIQVKFLEDLVKIKQLLTSKLSTQSNHHSPLISPSQTIPNDDRPIYPQPFTTSMLRNYNNNFNQGIYCTL